MCSNALPMENPENSDNWPPPLPAVEPVKIAQKMFFRHLRSLALERARSEKGQKMCRLLSPRGRPELFLDVDAENDQMRIAVCVEREIRMDIDDIFHCDSEVAYEMDYGIIAEALDTLPDDRDLRVIADDLAASFVSRNDHADIPQRIFTEEHPEGTDMDDEDIASLRASIEKHNEDIRMLYYAVLARTYKSFTEN